MTYPMVFKNPDAHDRPGREAIDAHYRADETACIERLLSELELSADQLGNIDAYARKLVEDVRDETVHKGGIDAFLHEYGLSTQEGVLLMCVAEALLRIPDDETREALIRDKLGSADWKKHLGHSSSLFVNASTWALMMTGQVVNMHGYKGRSPDAAIRRLVARLGEPVVRESTNQAMKVMGKQFVMGRTIEEALDRARDWEAKGYTYSYDMLGEAARTMDDAKRYFAAYKTAIEKIGKTANGRGPYKGPGISVKLSALHPRYELGQANRVMDELVPRLRALCVDAAKYDIGLNIDAEEADRLDISLDCMAAISADPELKDWQGFGVVVQAYQKRAPYVLGYLADMARRDGRRMMVRLVKGAYWDMEIKRAQELGLPGYPVFTRKANTDVSYLACARKLFENTDAFYPQLATHNAHSIASVLEFAGNNRDFEFQRLHGMGEEMYAHVIEGDKTGTGCRIYAPVGQHEDLLAYLVRRLLENGANSSFVNRVQDAETPVDEIIADPIAMVRAYARKPHPRIPMPLDIYGSERPNAKGVDITDRARLRELAVEMPKIYETSWQGGPIVDGESLDGVEAIAVTSPQNHDRQIGMSSEASDADIERALKSATKAAIAWGARPADERALCLERAADLMEADTARIMGLCVAEAGKTLMDAVAEIREAVDFCRYYAIQARQNTAGYQGGGIFTCISPWNFPFAIFCGQVTAALAAGNAVLAKPAEQTPIIGAEAVKILHAAGVPGDVLHLLPGDGARVGAALVKDERVTGVCFTGSTEVARIINRTLASRDGVLPPLIAETGGQNAMIVDSTALTEQVTRDVVVSSFQSAGQRCSALRVMFVQEDVADRTIGMIAGAMEELNVSDPALISTDVGPVIDAEAEDMLNGHIKRMLGEASEINRTHLSPGADNGTFVTPAAFEIESLSQLQREVFGPVLHVIRYKASKLDKVMEAINGTGYGLTLGVHTRIDDNWRKVYASAHVGNTYVNRNQIGAIVGVQPFGGQGLSGTGPKAGGPHYIHRFVTQAGEAVEEAASSGSLDDKVVDAKSLGAALSASDTTWSADVAERADIIEDLADQLEDIGFMDIDQSEADRAAACLRKYAAYAHADFTEPTSLPGPTGERNELRYAPRGNVLCMATNGDGSVANLIAQVGAALVCGNRALLWHPEDGVVHAIATAMQRVNVPLTALGVIQPGSDASIADMVAGEGIEAVALSGAASLAAEINRKLAESDAAIRPVIRFLRAPAGQAGFGQPLATSAEYLHRFQHERSLSIDTTASGGNASLLSIGDGSSSLPGEV